MPTRRIAEIGIVIPHVSVPEDTTAAKLWPQGAGSIVPALTTIASTLSLHRVWPLAHSKQMPALQTAGSSSVHNVFGNTSVNKQHRGSRLDLANRHGTPRVPVQIGSQTSQMNVGGLYEGIDQACRCINYARLRRRLANSSQVIRYSGNAGLLLY